MEAVPPNPVIGCDALAETREALDRLTAAIDRAMQTPQSPEKSDAIIYAGRVVHEMERTLAAHEVKAEAFTAAMKEHGDRRYEQGRQDEQQAAREEEPALLQLVSGDSIPRRRGPRVLAAIAPAAAIVVAVAAGPAHHHHAHVAARTAHAVPAAVQDYDGYVPARP